MSQPQTEPDGHSIIAQLIEGIDPGAMVTRFVVVAEIIAPNGERAVWVETHEGASRWDTYGLLEFALNENRIEHQRNETDDA